MYACGTPSMRSLSKETKTYFLADRETRMVNISRTCITLALLIGCSVGQTVTGANCTDLSPELQDALLQYVRKLANLSNDASLKLVANNVNERTCYRRLRFTAGDASLILFLSPDERFLSSNIFDSRSDPRLV